MDKRSSFLPKTGKQITKDIEIWRRLLDICYDKVKNRKDPSHDIYHVLRVAELAYHLGIHERADLQVVVPAAIFHDVIVYPKNSDKRHLSNEHSAEFAARVLKRFDYPSQKIQAVAEAIKCCSFSKGLKPASLEAQVVQDADLLESCGVVALMRGFASAGIMNKILFHPSDPFGKSRPFDDLKYGLDLVFTRYSRVPSKLNTRSAKRLVRVKIMAIREFLRLAKLELNAVRKLSIFDWQPPSVEN